MGFALTALGSLRTCQSAMSKRPVISLYGQILIRNDVIRLHRVISMKPSRAFAKQ